ncbi:MAG: hypothetical protein ACKV0T_25660 [Planctomycetales bacterium]
MPYDVDVPTKIQRIVSSWGLPPTIEAEIYDQMDAELSSHPSECLIKIQPDGVYEYVIRRDVSGISKVFAIYFEFVERDHGRALLAIDASNLTITKVLTGKSLPVGD